MSGIGTYRGIFTECRGGRMSDVITGPGEYRQRDGRKATVVDVRGGVAIGWDGDGEYCAWFVDEGERTRGVLGFSIVGPWVEPQPEKPDPGDGWRLLEDDEVVNDSDQFLYMGRDWCDVHSSIGFTKHEALSQGKLSPMNHVRRRIDTPSTQQPLKWLPCQWNETGAASLYGMNGYFRLHTLAADGTYQPVEVQQ
jgi:hypothetical protein